MQLVRLGALAENYFQDDPNTCVMKLRQLGELLAQQVAARTGVYIKWLRVLDPAEPPHIDHRIGHQLHAVVAPLDTLEPQQQPLEFVLPRKGPLHAIP